jgi:UDP-N-acetylmuramoyl-L-alanyl-D-glutamate--2,6-diaminopimelate ligase
MKVKQLIKDHPEIAVKGSKEVEITGITSESQFCAPGNLFVAKRGKKFDGASFIPQAVRAGAVAILCDMYDPSLSCVQLIHPDVQLVEKALAALFYDFPAKKLWMAAVTGTNGKTTTAYVTRHLLEYKKVPCGLIGSIEYLVGQKQYTASHTTPDVCKIQRLLQEMCAGGCQACVMEVSSHALDQARVAAIEYDAAVFTNLSHEHLDYHSTMERYFESKALLFRTLPQRAKAIINNDDPWARRFIQASTAPVITYGLQKDADLFASSIQSTAKGSSFAVSYQGKEEWFSWPLVGAFNVSNALAAIGVLLAKGFSLQEISQGLKSFHTVSGRLEVVANQRGLHIFVDYAHKAEALKKVLEMLREIAKKRIITVFGCGGDRDREKRPMMAAISEKLSDITVVTSDNPRSEDPQKIIQEILFGFSPQAKVYVEPDRKEAIGKAIEMASEGDIVLIAGKGHEKKQLFAHRTIDFDDKMVAWELANAK